MLPRISAALWLLLALSTVVYADEIRPGLLQLQQVADQQFEVSFKTPARGPDQRLALYVEFDDGVTTVSKPQGGVLAGAHLSHWRISQADNLAGTRIFIRGLANTTTDVLLRVEFLSGNIQLHRLSPQQPQIVLPAKQSWLSIAGSYLWLGIEHILLGFDHLLFVLALLLLVDGFYKLVATITAFTIAHSITLVLSSLQLISLPIAPVEAVIALSIVFVASEVIHLQQGRVGLSARRPWLVAFVFGLLHGLGFAAVLAEIGLPEDALFTALLLFNVGVEVGQLLFVGVLLTGWLLLRRYLGTLPTGLRRVPAYGIGILATFWVFERTAGFWQL